MHVRVSGTVATSGGPWGDPAVVGLPWPTRMVVDVPHSAAVVWSHRRWNSIWVWRP